MLPRGTIRAGFGASSVKGRAVFFGAKKRKQDKTVRHIVEKRLFNTLYYLLAHLDDFVYHLVHEIE